MFYTKTWTILLSIGLMLIFSHPVFAQTRLSLHVTQEELTIWQQRAASGPYKTAGDVSTNSPGDYTRILSKANTFIGAPTADRWTGQVAASCVQPYSSALPEQNRTLGEKLRDAGFTYLITGTASYRDAVRTELLAQAAEVGTNWADNTRWCTASMNDANPYFDITMWMTKLLFGYSYIRPSLTTGDQATLDAWFLAAAIKFEVAVQQSISQYFVDRTGGDLTLSSSGLSQGLSGRITHYGGFDVTQLGLQYNNRKASLVTFFGITGVLTNNTALKQKGKRYIKEYLAYGIFPDGTPDEFERWDTNLPTLGWGYSGTTLGYLVALADHFARDGDLEPYTFSTSLGVSGTAGGPKTLKLVIDHYLTYLNHATSRYGTDQAGNNGNAAYLIDSEYTDWSSNRDIGVVPANVYYQDAAVKAYYRRQTAGTPVYPSSPESGGYETWGGSAGGIYPGILFMFGQMDGLVTPYGVPGVQYCQ